MLDHTGCKFALRVREYLVLGGCGVGLPERGRDIANHAE